MYFHLFLTLNDPFDEDISNSFNLPEKDKNNQSATRKYPLIARQKIRKTENPEKERLIS